MPKYIVSFDIGKKNFAFVIEELAGKYNNLPDISKKSRYYKTGDSLQ